MACIPLTWQCVYLIGVRSCLIYNALSSKIGVSGEIPALHSAYATAVFLKCFQMITHSDVQNTHTLTQTYTHIHTRNIHTHTHTHIHTTHTNIYATHIRQGLPTHKS